jgi:hypothetical protein
MKIEFNGRVVAGFLLGAFCGAVGLLVASAGPIGKIQRERDEARATVERQNAQIQQLQSTKSSAPAAASPLQLLDVVRPGLGTLAVAADKAIKADQPKRAAVAAQAASLPQPVSCGPDQVLAMGQCITCNPGLRPGTFANGDAGCVPQ